VRIHETRDPNTGASAPLSRPVILTIAKDGKGLEVKSAGEHDSREVLKGKMLTLITKFPD
jgi:hypothetical protein